MRYQCAMSSAPDTLSVAEFPAPSREAWLAREGVRAPEVMLGPEQAILRGAALTWGASTPLQRTESGADGDYRDLFTTRQSFMTRALGIVYRVPVPSPDEWEAFEFPPDSERE